MMTVAKLSAGDGYAYYTRHTAAGDTSLKAGQELGDYYLATGTPAGQWMGAGTHTLAVSGEVSESQMKSLFGLGFHPNAQQTMAAMISAGASAEEAQKWAQLGRRYATFKSPSSELSRAIDEALATAEERQGVPLDPGQRRAVRMKTSSIMFQERHGRRPKNPQELTTWMGQQFRSGQAPVAGFDLTFSAPKSVSVVWATADEATSQAVERAHQQALEEALAYLEGHAIYGRAGAGGSHQVAVEGAVATRFRHWTSREGDPQLHDHLVISNKVRRADLDPATPATEGWVTIDGQTLYRHVHAASAVYDRALADRMRGLGFAMENRSQPTEKKLRMEVAGITDETIAEFSARRRQITAKTNELIEEWEKEHGREADTWTRNRLAQEATLATRSKKEATDPFPDLVAKSRSRLTQSLPDRNPYRTLGPRDIDVDGAARELLEALSSRRSTWNLAHLETRLNMWGAAHGASPAVLDQVRAATLSKAVSLTPESTAPDLLRQASTTKWFTTQAVMDAESSVIDAAAQLALPTVTPAQFDAALAAHEDPLDEGQIALARTFATGEHLVETGIGPAGAGKTTAMRLCVEAVEASGHRVIGLSTNARAAEVFATETGTFATSLAMWTTQRHREQPAPEFRLQAGDIIIVDEASMASTQHLAQVLDDARQAGAFVRLLGDPAQLGAVESGGLLRELDRRYGATRLETLWRFVDVAEADASVRLATTGEVTWYAGHDRIHGVAADDLPDRVMRQWFDRTQAGHDVAVMASTNDEVTTLNQAAQKLRREAGQVDHTRTVDLRDGTQAGIGDIILTRAVDRKLTTTDGHSYVHNGDRWTVTDLTPAGDIVATDAGGHRVILPADYVRASTQLGYASTVHVAQGRTVDQALLVVSDRTDRQGLYVGMTRGRESNEAFVPLSGGRSAHQVVEAAARRVSEAQSAHEVMAIQQQLVDDPAQAIRIFRAQVAEADRPRFDAHIRASYADIYGPGRELEAASAADVLIQSDSRAALDNALRRSEAAGFSVPHILAATAPERVTGAADPARVVAWRIDRHLTRAAATTPSADGPLAIYTDAQLTALAERSAAELAAAKVTLRDAARLQRDEPTAVAMKNGQQAPAWTDRPHGYLTRDELSDALDDAQAAVTDSTAQVHDARDELDVARKEWRELNVDGHRTSPQAIEAAERVEYATGALAAAQETDRLARSDYAELHDELRTRRHMTGKSWAQETRSRDAAAARQAVPERYVDPAEAVTHRYATHEDLEQAHQAHSRASIIHAQVRSEQNTRALTPDMAAPYRVGLPTWAGASNALHDDLVPEARREQLVDAAGWLTQHLANRGEALALDPSQAPWTRELGPVPTDQNLRDRWATTAGRIDAYRRLAGYTEPDRALPTARRGSREASEIHTLRAALSDLRRDIARAPKIPTTPRQPTSPWTQLQGRPSVTTLTQPDTRTTPQEETMSQPVTEQRETVATHLVVDDQHELEHVALDRDHQMSHQAMDRDHEAAHNDAEQIEPATKEPAQEAPASGSNLNAARDRLQQLRAQRSQSTAPLSGNTTTPQHDQNRPARTRRGPKR